MEKEIEKILDECLGTTSGWGSEDCTIEGKKEAIKQLTIFILKKELELFQNLDGNCSDIYHEVYHIIADLEKELKNYE